MISMLGQNRYQQQKQQQSPSKSVPPYRKEDLDYTGSTGGDTSKHDPYVRACTYVSFPQKLSAVNVDDLCDSGFYYLGKGDQVKCFQCGLKLEKWNAHDVVDVEHAKYKPNCPFLVKKCGRTFVDIVLRLDRFERGGGVEEETESVVAGAIYEFTASGGSEKTGDLEATSPVANRTWNPGTEKTGPSAVGCLHNLPYSSHVDDPSASLELTTTTTKTTKQNTEVRRTGKLHHVAPRDVRARLDTDQFVRLMSMGYSKDLLAQVICERLATVGDDFENFIQLFNAVQEAEKVLYNGTVDTCKSYLSGEKKKPLPLKTTDIKPEATLNIFRLIQTSFPDSINPEPKSEDDTSSRHRKKDCNVCFDDEVNTVLIPCRHMVTCSTCADKMRNCPVCRRRIEDRVKVYRS